MVAFFSEIGLILPSFSPPDRAGFGGLYHYPPPSTATLDYMTFSRSRLARLVGE